MNCHKITIYKQEVVFIQGKRLPLLLAWHFWHVLRSRKQEKFFLKFF